MSCEQQIKDIEVAEPDNKSTEGLSLSLIRLMNPNSKWDTPLTHHHSEIFVSRQKPLCISKRRCKRHAYYLLSHLEPKCCNSSSETIGPRRERNLLKWPGASPNTVIIDASDPKKWTERDAGKEGSELFVATRAHLHKLDGFWTPITESRMLDVGWDPGAVQKAHRPVPKGRREFPGTSLDL